MKKKFAKAREFIGNILKRLAGAMHGSGAGNGAGAVLGAVAALCLFATGCPDRKTVDDDNPFMVSIPAMSVTGSDAWAVPGYESYDWCKGVFISGRTVTLSAYTIAKYETTYELWYEVKIWAASNGYTFANAGREGCDGTDGAAPTSAAKSEPVTMVSWQDVIVWCNAYSEMTGKTPAYYSDSACATVIKSLSNGNAAAADTVYVKAGVSGYRLPTEAEWEAAARSGNPSDTTKWGCTYAGSSTIGDVAWYWDNKPSTYTAPVGTKAANSAGLYDMSGNVWEWCWDWYGSSVGTGTTANPAGVASGTYRVVRGGGWIYGAANCAVAYRSSYAPSGRLSYLGFRVVCAP